MKATIVFLLLSFSIQHYALTSISTLRMHLLSGVQKCIGQDFDEGDEALFKVGASSTSHHEHAHSVLVTVADSNSLIVSTEKLMVTDTKKIKEIPLSIKVHGMHEMCFEYQGHDDKTAIKVHFGIDFNSKKKHSGKGVDPSKKLKIDDIPSFESELLAAEESLNDISREIEFARKQEISLTDAAESTASRVQWFSIFSIIILIVTSLWQILYLRHFFTSKKIL